MLRRLSARRPPWDRDLRTPTTTYMIWMGTKRGYLPKRYEAVARQGYRGVLTKLSIDESGLTNFVDISASTPVGDLAFYVGRDRNVNDLNGLGAFLIMNEALAAPTLGCTPKRIDWTLK